MPIYEYACSTCGEVFAYLARTFSDKPKTCTSCGAKTISKQFSTFAPPAAVSKGCGSCVNEAACPAASMSGIGCAGACGHRPG